MGRLFGTDGVRGIANSELTPELAFKLGKAGAHVLSRDSSRPVILIGKDTRLSGDLLEDALSAGILAVGGNVLKVGVLPTPALAYLVRAEGCAFHASVGTMSGCLLNILLDPVFIMPWGFGMGAAGAGLATFLSNCVACIYFFVLMLVRRKRTYICLSPKALCLEKGIVYGVCGVGIPAAIQNLLNVTGMTVLNNFTSVYGADAVAAMGIAQKVNMVPMYISQGLSQGFMPLISYNYASGNTKRMKEGLVFVVKLAMPFMVMVSLGYYLFAGPLVGLFMNNQAIIDYGTKFLHGFCLGLPFLCMDFVAVGVFQACGMGSRALVFAILRKIVLELPALYVLNRLFPLYGLSYAQFVTEVILAFAAVITLLRIFQRLSKRGSKLQK